MPEVKVEEKKEPTRQEKMGQVREKTKLKFEQMRLKATNAVKNLASSSASSTGVMGRIKGFGELQDSLMKMRENFDYVLGGMTMSSPPASTTVDDDSCC